MIITSVHWLDPSETTAVVTYDDRFAYVPARREANGNMTVMHLGDDASRLRHWLTEHTLPSYRDAMAPHAEQVERAFEAQRVLVIGSLAKRGSVRSYQADLLVRAEAILPGAVPLTDAEKADLTMAAALEAWDSAAVEVRNAAIAAGTPIADITWPTAPAGSAAWLLDY